MAFASRIALASLVAIGFAALLAASLRSASGSIVYTADGLFWEGRNADEKSAIVAGLLSGYHNGYVGGSLNQLGYDLTTTATTKGTSMHEPTELLFTHSGQFYVDGIDSFYSNNADLITKVDIGRVLLCLADNPRVSCDDTAKAFRSSRR